MTTNCISTALLSLVLTLAGIGYADAKNTTDKDSAILIGAGDIADCADLSGAEATSKLLENSAGTVLAIGDLAYPDGSKENFACYDKRWGRVKSRTRPAVGNRMGGISFRRRYTILRLFRSRRGRSEKGLLQLRARRVAHRRAQ